MNIVRTVRLAGERRSQYCVRMFAVRAMSEHAGTLHKTNRFRIPRSRRVLLLIILL